MVESLRFSPEPARINKEVRSFPEVLRAQVEQEAETERSEQVNSTDPEDVLPSSDAPESPQPSFQTLHNLVVAYDGLFAQQMQWALEEIVQYLQAADVTQRVTIERGSNRPGVRDYESVGFAAIWKQLGNPLDLLSSYSNDGSLEIVPNFATNEIKIRLHDQEILFSLPDKEKNKVGFIKKVNELVQQGLVKAATESQQHQLKESVDVYKYQAALVAIILGTGAGAVGTPIGIGKLLKVMSSSEFFNLFDIIVTFTFGVLFTIILVNFAGIATLMTIKNQIEFHKNRIKFPLIHVWQIVRAQLSSVVSNAKYVVLKDSQ